MGASAAIGMIVGGGASQAYGQYQAGQTNRSIDRWNARVADLQAQDALDRGAVQQGLSERATARTIGEQRAGFAGQGVVVGVGSAGDVVDETRALGRLDAETIQRNAELEAWGYRTQAADLRFRGRVAAAEGDNEAFGTLLTTGADAYGTKWRTDQGVGRGTGQTSRGR